MSRFRVGTSGWQYDHWRGVLYPAELAKKHWFRRYAEEFDTVEVNNTFYHLPEAKVFDDWREQAPPGFLYALKFSRFGTHLKHLKDPEEPIARFLDRARHLKRTLGPILVQLPPHWKPDVPRLADFLSAAPARHRWAVELRDARWLRDDVLETLAQHGAALCLHDMIEDHPLELTTDWTYLRYHGKNYAGGYTPQKLSADARRIQRWLDDGKDVYAYFNNDVGAHAVHDAKALARHVARRSHRFNQTSPG